MNGIRMYKVIELLEILLFFFYSFLHRSLVCTLLDEILGPVLKTIFKAFHVAKIVENIFTT